MYTIINSDGKIESTTTNLEIAVESLAVMLEYGMDGEIQDSSGESLIPQTINHIIIQSIDRHTKDIVRLQKLQDTLNLTWGS
jgi:hypothetical protein